MLKIIFNTNSMKNNYLLVSNFEIRKYSFYSKKNILKCEKFIHKNED